MLFLVPVSLCARTIKIGVAHFDPPFVVQLDAHHYDGFDVAMIHYICKKMQYECVLVAYKRNRLMDAVASGEVDMAVSQLIVSERNSAKVNFSIPYLINVAHVIGLKKLVNGHFDLSLLFNQKIGLTDEDYKKHIVELNLKSPNITMFEQDDELIEALHKGVVGFALVDTYTASYWNINSSNLIADFGSPVQFESAVAIAVNPQDSSLLEKINWALTNYRNSHDFVDDYNKYLLYF